MIKAKSFKIKIYIKLIQILIKSHQKNQNLITKVSKNKLKIN